MSQLIFIFLGIVLHYICNAQSSQNISSPFHFTAEARAKLCPFVGYKGLRCFDNDHMKRSGAQPKSGILKLPRGVGMSVDQSTGEIKALAVELTYSQEGSRVWTDGFTGNMYDMINEAAIGPASTIVAALNASRVHIFQNASQINAIWQQRFTEGKIRGGELANWPNMLEYDNEYFKNGDGVALSQRMIGLYTLQLNKSTIRLNSFAQQAISRLTITFDPDLYEAFIDVWGTHIITRSLVGGMVEEQAKVLRCYRAADNVMFARCIPFRDRHHINTTNCGYYAAQAHVRSRRQLGGDVNLDIEHEWKKTLASEPALLQILEMVPWYNFVTNEIVKKNLQSAIRCRQEKIDSIEAEAVRQVDSRLFPCTSAPFGLLHIKANATWKKNGITVAGGNGAGDLPSQLNSPHGLFVDDDGTLYIADHSNHRIVEWKVGASSGRVVAGGNGQGSAASQLHFPHDAIVDKSRNSLLIVDHENHRVVRWPLKNGISGETIISSGYFTYLTMDEEGSIYVGEWDGQHIRRWRFGESQATVVAGGNGVGSQLNQINNPRKIFVDRNRSVYVSEYYNHRVTKWVEGAKEGIIVAGGNGKGNSLSQLDHPEGIVVDQFGRVYVADLFNHRIMRWAKGDKEGEVLLGGLGAGSQSNQLNEPIGLAFDRNGNLFITEHRNHRVQKFEIY